MFELRLTIPVPRSVLGTGLTARILTGFQAEAGKRLVEAVRSQLGTDDIYQLSANYAKEKPKRKGYKRQSGKSDEQPLIFRRNVQRSRLLHRK